MSDLTYTTDGVFVQVMPLTEDGHGAFTDICECFTGGKLPANLLGKLKGQLRVAGITIRKAKPVKMTHQQDVELLKELGVGI